MLSSAAGFPRSLTLHALLDSFQEARSRVLEKEVLPIDADTGRLRVSSSVRPMLSGMGQVMFVRHGETHANDCGFLAGISDHQPFNQLTAAGRAQAAEAGMRLRLGGTVYDRMLVSPLGRARETAAIVFKTLIAGKHPEIPVNVLPILSEHDCGVLENVSIKSTEAQLSKGAAILGGLPEVLPVNSEREKLMCMKRGDMRVGQAGGESIGDVMMRQNLALSYIQNHFPGENIIIVAHSIVGATMKALIKPTDLAAIDDTGLVNLFDSLPKHGVPERLN